MCQAVSRNETRKFPKSQQRWQNRVNRACLCLYMSPSLAVSMSPCLHVSSWQLTVASVLGYLYLSLPFPPEQAYHGNEVSKPQAKNSFHLRRPTGAIRTRCRSIWIVSAPCWLMTVHSIVVGSLFLGATLGYSSNVHWYAEIIGTLDWSLAPFLKSLCLSVYQKRLERVQLSWPHSVAPLHPHLPPFPLCLLPAVMKMQHGTSLKMIDTPGEGLRNRSNLSQGKSKRERKPQ